MLSLRPQQIVVCEQTPVWTNRLVRAASPNEWQFQWQPLNFTQVNRDVSIFILAPRCDDPSWGNVCQQLFDCLTPQQVLIMLADVDAWSELMLREWGVRSVLPYDTAEPAVLRTLSRVRADHSSTLLR